ncbi:MAG: cellulase family glycosylhydrolase [Acidimicrobiales bacterium]
MALVNTACSSGLVGLPLPKTTVATTTSTSTPGHSPRVAHLPVLRVVGDRLELSSGRRFVMRGVNVYAMPFYETNGKADPALASVTANAYANRKAMFARVKALGFNTVKIPISAGIYASDPYIRGAKNGYLARLRAIVDTATSEGLYVVLCWWDALGEGSSVLRDYAHQYPMMKAVAHMFSDNPGVIYEPLGEPNRISWEQWVVMSEKMLRYCRATMGYRAVIIADTDDWSWNFDPTYVRALIRYDGALLGKPNLLIANHRYPNRNTCFCGGTLRTWNSLVGQYIDHFPFVGSEYGIFNGIGSVELSWGKDFLSYLKHTAIPSGFNGALMFVWNWVDPNTMTNPKTGKLTAWGAAIVASLAVRPSPVSAG